jgi:hypothetical protein
MSSSLWFLWPRLIPTLADLQCSFHQSSGTFLAMSSSSSMCLHPLILSWSLKGTLCSTWSHHSEPSSPRHSALITLVSLRLPVSSPQLRLSLDLLPCTMTWEVPQALATMWPTLHLPISQSPMMCCLVSNVVKNVVSYTLVVSVGKELIMGHQTTQNSTKVKHPLSKMLRTRNVSHSDFFQMLEYLCTHNLGDGTKSKPEIHYVLYSLIHTARW